jgi:hypothetical protein
MSYANISSAELIGAYDQGSPFSIYDQNMRPKDSSLGISHVVARLFATTIEGEYSTMNEKTNLTTSFILLS